jgi:hypothetical protein
VSTTNEAAIWQKRLFWLIFWIVAGLVLVMVLITVASYTLAGGSKPKNPVPTQTP